MEQVGPIATLEWVIERLQWNNAGIRSLAPTTDRDRAAQDQEAQTKQQISGLPPPLESDADAAAAAAEFHEEMKRRRSQSDKEGINPSRRAVPPLQPAPPPGIVYSPVPLAGPSRYAPVFSPSMPDESWRNPYFQPGEQPPVSHSPRRTASSTSSAFHQSQHSPMLPPQYPQQQPQMQPGRMLPSPSSLNFPSAPQPPAPPPLVIGQASPSALQHPQTSPSVHAHHLQDLQHQVSVKTLTLQTLQREYDALLAKLERQRTKCITLEKKFEVSDVEINSLTEERERLQAQVAILEGQAEELTRGRDDARREMAESGRQYVRIVEMANRLQAQGADERKRWEDERRELMDTVRAMELGLPAHEEDEEIGAEDAEAAIMGPTQRDAGLGDTRSRGPSGSREGEAESSVERPTAESEAPHKTGATPTTRSPNPIPALRAEVRRLRSRTQALEGVIRTMREENTSMQETLQSVTASGQRLQESMDKALGA